MKKIYEKPEAQYVSFYSEEAIAELNESLDNGMNTDMTSVNLGDYGVDWE